MWDELQEFAVRGNMTEMAVGIIAGGAFGKIVTSLVNDVVMPPIGLIMGQVDFSQKYFNLAGGDYGSLVKTREAGAVTLNYGQFLTTVLDFLIVAGSCSSSDKSTDSGDRKNLRRKQRKTVPIVRQRFHRKRPVVPSAPPP